jgi:hypothetical protein
MKLSWRDFLLGTLCGAIVIAAVGAAWLRWKPVHELDWSNPDPIVRSAEDEDSYDRCLISHAGNKVVCDALMRVLDRERIADAEMKEVAARLLAAGSTKCEVVLWGLKNGYNGTQMSEAVGISFQDAVKC